MCYWPNVQAMPKPFNQVKTCRLTKTLNSWLLEWDFCPFLIEVDINFDRNLHSVFPSLKNDWVTLLDFHFTGRPQRQPVIPDTVYRESRCTCMWIHYVLLSCDRNWQEGRKCAHLARALVQLLFFAFFGGWGVGSVKAEPNGVQQWTKCRSCHSLWQVAARLTINSNL